jgi:hypothetical protein
LNEELRLLTLELESEKRARREEVSKLKTELEVSTLQIQYLNNELSKLKIFRFKQEVEVKSLKRKVQATQNWNSRKKGFVVRGSPSVTFRDVMDMDDKTRASFTGFLHASSIEVLNKMLKYKGLLGQTKVICIRPEDQLILFLMKIRLDLPNRVLGSIFKVSIYTVSNIVNTYLSGLYEMFYEGSGPLTRIPTRFENATSLPSCFSGMKNCRIVIDCTEFAMQAPSKLQDKKAMYSSYKSKYTMKSLIGCAPNGTVVFVSDLYGGSESDKSIVLSSKLLEKMDPGDLILADKGFELFDVLPPGVSLNIPSFLTKDQFTIEETLRNRSYARARIIVERLNARIKIYKILNCIDSKNRSNADRFVKVCVALTTLMPTLMDELNKIE